MMIILSKVFRKTFSIPNKTGRSWVIEPKKTGKRKKSVNRCVATIAAVSQRFVIMVVG
jgi:hypothetical protein